MLWKVVDVLVIVLALGALLAFGPSVIGLSKWKDRFTRRAEESEQRKAG